MKTTYFIALSGLRGGVGTTSMVALLADALCAQGEAVLVVDLNPADLLRLHFNTPYEEKSWALSPSTAHGWREQCYQRGRLLQVLPYGYHGLSDAPVREPQAIPIWRQLIQYVWTEADEGQPDWVLFCLEGPAWRRLWARYLPWFAHLLERDYQYGDPLRFVLQFLFLCAASYIHAPLFMFMRSFLVTAGATVDVNHELQVWLEVDGQQNPPVIIPMVQSPVAQPAQYYSHCSRRLPKEGFL